MRELAVVTGGSEGIGFELAVQFATHDYDLLLIARDPEGLERAATQLRTHGGSVDVFAADLATYEGTESVAEAITALGRPVDAIALNAGIGLGGDFARTTDLEKELRLIDVNVKSTIHLAKRVLPGMIARNRGRMLITSSIAAVQPAPFEAVYGATKAFLFLFAESIRNELNDTDLTITVLLPGPTETDIYSDSEMEDTIVGRMKKDAPALVARRGFDALMKGEDKVYGGSFKYRMLASISEVVPESLTAYGHRLLTQPREAPKKALGEVESP